MAKQADRVKETSKSLGKNDMLLEGAVFGAQPFSVGYNVGDTDIRYVIAHQTKDEWEVGRGTLVSPISLQRDEVIENSENTNQLLSFTTGTKEIFSAPDSRDITGLYNSLTDYNVLDYGVLGNGTSDDTNGIRKAIDKARQNNGGVIFFPPGRYKVTQSGMLEDILKIDFSNVVIRGTDPSITEVFTEITYPKTSSNAAGDTTTGDINSDFPIYIEYQGSGGFVVNETVTGQSSGATALIEKVYNTTNTAGSGSISNKCLVISNISGTFQLNEQIKGNSSSAVSILKQTPRLWRGSIFQIAGSANPSSPIKNITFENITLNGSTDYELSTNSPADVSTGNGIDYSHKGIYVLKDTWVDNIQIRHNVFTNFRGPVVSTKNSNTHDIKFTNNKIDKVKIASQVTGYLSCLNNEFTKVAAIGHQDDLYSGRYANNRYRDFENEAIETRSRNGNGGVEFLNINNCIFDNIKSSVITVLQGHRGQGNINNNTIKNSAYKNSTSSAIQCVKRGSDYATFSNLRITQNLISVSDQITQNALHFDWDSSVTEVSNIVVDYNTVNGNAANNFKIKNSLVWNGRSTIATYSNNIIRNNTFNDCDNPPQNTGTSVTNFGKPFPLVAGNMDNGFTNEPELVADGSVKYPFYNRYQVKSTGGEEDLYVNKDYYTKGQEFNFYGSSNANTAILPLDNNTLVLDKTWVGSLGNTIKVFYCPEQNVFLEQYRADRLGPVATQSTGTVLDASGKNKLILDYSSPVVITDFQNFPERDKVLIHSQNGNVTLASNTRIRNSAGTNLRLPPGGTVEYIQINDTLHQVGLDTNFKIYNVRFYGAMLDGVTDDRKAIQDAIDEAGTLGGGYVVVDGPAYLESYTTYEGISSHLFVTSDNVVVYLTPQAKLISNEESVYTIGIGGYFNTNWLEQSLYPLEPTDVYLKSSHVVQLEVQSDISNFNEDDLVYIRTGDTNVGSAEAPIQCVNKVARIKLSTAELELYEPLPRKFELEQYSTLDPINSGDAPFGILNLSSIPDSYTRNSGVDGFGRLESSGPIIYARQCINCYFKNWLIKTDGTDVGFMHSVFDSRLERFWVENDNLVNPTRFTWWGGTNNVSENNYFATPGLLSYVIANGETNHLLTGITLLSNVLAREAFLITETGDELITDDASANILIESNFSGAQSSSNQLTTSSGNPILTQSGSELSVENSLTTDVGSSNIAVLHRAEDTTIEYARLYSRVDADMIKVDDTSAHGYIDMTTLNNENNTTISVPSSWYVSNNVSIDRITTLSGDSAYESGNKPLSLDDFSSTEGSPTLETFNVLYQGWMFDATSNETISTTFHNKNWRKYKIEILYTNPNTVLGDVVWQTSINGYTLNSTLDSSNAGALNVTVASPNQFEINSVIFDLDFDIPLESLVRIDIKRLATDGSDTLNNDISIIGIKAIRKE